MKKSIFLFFFCLMFVQLSAQTTKVAILELVDREGGISYANKLMIKSNLVKAVASIPGYEAYDRVVIENVGSQNFQQTGVVSNPQIVTIGETTGAKYILVVEGAKVDDANVFVSAQILNTTTALTEANDNMLLNVTSGNLLQDCKTLVNKLLNLQSAEPVELVSLQNSSTIGETPSKSSQNCSPLQLGTLKRFEDGTCGIVFYATEDGHGLVVSLKEEDLEWADSWGDHDIDSIVNEREENISLVSGEYNTTAMINQLGIEDAPAAFWCRTFGPQWYLPSMGELIYLLKIANLEEDEDGPISRALNMHGGDDLEGWYWSSSEEDDENAWNVSASGKIGTEEKDKKLNVRAVRAF